MGEGVLQNQQEYHIILTKYEAVHPTAVSENTIWHKTSLKDTHKAKSTVTE